MDGGEQPRPAPEGGKDPLAATSLWLASVAWLWTCLPALGSSAREREVPVLEDEAARLGYLAGNLLFRVVLPLGIAAAAWASGLLALIRRTPRKGQAVTGLILSMLYLLGAITLLTWTFLADAR